MLERPREDLVANTAEYERLPLVRATGFREYDARWLFGWTTPFLPEGWHGVHAHEGSPGTTVIVRSD